MFLQLPFRVMASIVVLSTCGHSAATYNGGIGDGSNVGSITAITLAGESISILYGGGSGDGYSVSTLTANSLAGQAITPLYQGGSGDGASVLLKQATSLTGQTFASLFGGGSGDGSASVMLMAHSLAGQSFTSLYQGGSGDGADVELLSSTSLEGQQFSVLYGGGFGDGHSKNQESDLFGNYFADTDDDGMPDGWEDENGLNHNDGSDADLDGDGDHTSNLEEYLADTDPNDPTSYFWMRARLSITGDPEVYFQSSANRYYLLETSPDLSNWTDQGLFTLGTGGEVSRPLPNSGPEHFGRIIVRKNAP